MDYAAELREAIEAAGLVLRELEVQLELDDHRRLCARLRCACARSRGRGKPASATRSARRSLISPRRACGGAETLPAPRFGDVRLPGCAAASGDRRLGAGETSCATCRVESRRSQAVRDDVNDAPWGDSIEPRGRRVRRRAAFA